MCTINENHMMYSSWDMKHSRQNFLSFWAIFCTFTSQQPKKSKFWKNEKSTWIYHPFTLVYHKWQSYDVWFLKYEAWLTEFFVVLGQFFLKKWKKKCPWDIVILIICAINENHMMYGFPRYGVWQTIFSHFGPFFALLPP